ncbi:MAG: hypothetical protein IKD37_05280 [Clostridia bacterium]|nr:hypothetical protein [Clostridia bacterium]
MFNKKQSKQVLAISLIVAAFSMVAVFLSVCIRKKSLTKALLAIAAMEGALGTLLLWQQSLEDRRAATPRFSFDGPNEELFDEAEVDAVEDQMGDLLGSHTATDREAAGKQLFTIPVDEDTTVADFM